MSGYSYYFLVDVGLFIGFGVLIWRISAWKKGGVDLAVSKEIPKLEDKINNLENRIDGLHLPRTTKTHSPLNLNDFGEKVSKKT